MQYLFRSQSVYDWAFAHVRITNKSDGYLFVVLVQFSKLPQQVDKSSLAKGMFDWSMERHSGVLGAQKGHPLLCDPGGNQVHLVQHKDQVFVSLFLLHVLLNVGASGAQRIPCIQDLKVHSDQIMIFENSQLFAQKVYSGNSATRLFWDI